MNAIKPALKRAENTLISVLLCAIIIVNPEGNA